MTSEQRDAPGVVVFPPLLFGGTLLVGLLLHWMWPIHPFPARLARVLGAILVVPCIVLARWGEMTMRRAGTNVLPSQPTLAIVSDGPFRYTRNPLYVSTAGLYLAFSLLFDALWPLALFLPMALVLRYGIVGREERYLEAKFGEPYRTYQARVRRWL